MPSSVKSNFQLPQSAPGGPPSFLQVVDLTLYRGDRRLISNLSFSVQPRTLLHVLGRNGSGKTTLLRALCGLITPQEGAILWQQESIRSLREEYGRELLYLGHQNGIKGDLTPVENLRVAAALDGDNIEEKAVWQALQQLGLAGLEDLPTRVLSQGQKRRVALARLMLGQATLWILDEPFTALDVKAVAQLEQLIADHVEQGGMAIITTHQEVPLTSGKIERLSLDG